MAPADMARALEAFPELAPWAARFLAVWTGAGGCTLDTLRFEMIQGDARRTLPAWNGEADAWFLDGFAPAKNPELWGAELMAEVAHHTAPEGSAATYTAAGFVRRRIPGYGRKRHMTRARMPR